MSPARCSSCGLHPSFKPRGTRTRRRRADATAKLQTPNKKERARDACIVGLKQAVDRRSGGSVAVDMSHRSVVASRVELTQISNRSSREVIHVPPPRVETLPRAVPLCKCLCDPVPQPRSHDQVVCPPAPSTTDGSRYEKHIPRCPANIHRWSFCSRWYVHADIAIAALWRS